MHMFATVTEIPEEKYLHSKTTVILILLTSLYLVFACNSLCCNNVIPSKVVRAQVVKLQFSIGKTSYSNTNLKLTVAFLLLSALLNRE